MKKVGRSVLVAAPFLALSIGLLSPRDVRADAASAGNAYCVVPPFISGNIPPNLMMMIDNSASMYDLRYQDTTNKYCANSPTTACTADSNCPSSGTCYQSVTTTTTTTYSPKACVNNAGCSLGGCKNGFCWKCDQASDPADCLVSTTSTSSPTTCTSNANCTQVTGDSCNNKCNVTGHQCYDATYNNNSTYNGYFTAAATYSYDFTNKKFTNGATMPLSSACTYSSGGYVCITTSTLSGSETATGFIATGNFLNWLTASKLDIEKQYLTGGKYNTTDNNLVAESRGCQGRKFIKDLAAADLTFAVWGGADTGVNQTLNLATSYGQSYIEIYKGNYNAGDCLSATNDWMNINSTGLGSFQTDTKGCVGSTSSTSVVNESSIYNHILHNCYQGITGGAQAYMTNINALENDCASVYKTLTSSQLVDPTAASLVCSSVYNYTDQSGNASTGFLGKCYDSDTKTWDSSCEKTQFINYCNSFVSGTPAADPSSNTTASQTVSVPGWIMEAGLANGMTDLGRLTVKVATATAPTGLLDKYKGQIRFGAITFQNNGSGSECVTPSGSTTYPSDTIFCAKHCSATTTMFCYQDSDCPLVSGSTTTHESCGVLPKTDGGVVISYIGSGICSSTRNKSCMTSSDCPLTESCTRLCSKTQTTVCSSDSGCPAGETCTSTPIGDHSSGLVNSIDNIAASSWTPFGEAFYNAIGYYARSNDYSTDPSVVATSRSDSNFSNLASPNTAASYDTNKNPSQYKCQKNNILLITDGMSTADKATNSEALATMYAGQVPYLLAGGSAQVKPGDAGYDSSQVHGVCAGSYSGTKDIAALAWVAKNRNIKTLTTSGTASTTLPQSASESINTYVVYSGPQAGSAAGLCDPYTLMNNTAINGGDQLHQASSPQDLYNELDKVLSAIAAQTSSGTAASILSNSEGSGANIVQAVFYPSKVFKDNTSAIWIGEMQNLWYYVDPMINNSSIREDTISPNVMNLLDDKVVSLRFDSATNTTWAYISRDTNGDGLPDTAETQVKADDVKSIWRAGRGLWERSTARDIRTSTDGSSLIPFTATNAATLAPYLNVNSTTAAALIPYIRGTDVPGVYRPRSVTDTDSSGATVSHPWLLGDIISSTPRIESTVRLNSYGLSSPGGYNDASYNSFIGSNDYKNRGMVYVGANDGMLHAFNLGILDVTASAYQKATLRPTVDSLGHAVPMGSEQWAYIPKQVLPYLKYYADTGYNHIYFVDGSTTLVDASIGDHTGANGCTASTYDTCVKQNSVVDGSNNVDSGKNTWRTVLVGGMGLGGASGCGTTNCVATPATVDSNPVGYSSYYALDVTNPLSPTLLWEFTDPGLGYATSGPAIVRVGDPLKNGRWYAVFGSGPTGPVDTANHQFGANSDQELKFFVVDLRTGALVKTIPTGIYNAFAGSIIGGSIDPDRWNPNVTGNYKDDAIYVGYVKKADDGTWTDGGVGRIVTNETTADDTTHPWAFSKVIDGIGPVTGAISRLQDRKNHNLWLFFGTGRFYNKTGTTLDDPTNRRAIFGIKEPCYNTSTKPGDRLDNACSTTIASGDVTDQSGTDGPLAAADSIGTGWKITLDAAFGGFGAERVVSDTVALTNGTIFVTSFMPTADPCNFGGNSFLWALDYKSGNRPADAALAGKALIQLSTGEFKQVDLTQAFGAGSARLMRRTSAAMSGKPPADAFPVVSKSANKPVKRILHIQER